MQTFGTILGVILILGMAAYIGFSLFKVIRDLRDKRRNKDEHYEYRDNKTTENDLDKK